MLRELQRNMDKFNRIRKTIQKQNEKFHKEIENLRKT